MSGGIDREVKIPREALDVTQISIVSMYTNNFRVSESFMAYPGIQI